MATMAPILRDGTACPLLLLIAFLIIVCIFAARG